MERSGVVVPRKAATVLLLRDGTGGHDDSGPDDHDGLEVLLLRRRAGSGFAAGMWVFPGGTVDDADRRPPAEAYTFTSLGERCRNLRVGPELVLGWHVAAVREAFEEAGLLITTRRPGSDAPGHGGHGGPGRGEHLSEWLAGAGFVADLDALVPFSRWVTPRASSRRFDTLFLVAAAPSGQEPVPDGQETAEARWVRPRIALEEVRAGELRMIHPTIRTLEALAASATVSEVLEGASCAGPLKPVMPHIVVEGDGPSTLLEPDDPGYPPGPYAEEFAEWT